jgi:hypothetical protein
MKDENQESLSGFGAVAAGITADAPKWNEHLIAGEIARQTLARKCVVLVDNCNWTGRECDVLAVTTDLRIIDVEVKISRSDLKADAKKDKWWHCLSYSEALERGIDIRTWNPWDHRTPLEWPVKVWKHYYAMPADIWKPELRECLPSKASGILLLHGKKNGRIVVTCERKSTPNKDAARLTPAQAIDIARLANLRMWDAYRDAESARQAVIREQTKVAA